MDRPRIVSPGAIVYVATLLYPFIVFLCYYLAAQSIAGIVAAILLASRAYLYLENKIRRLYQVITTVCIAVSALAIFQASDIIPLLLPAFINFSLLGLFASSLLTHRNIIERIARSMKGDLPSEGVTHCRRACTAWSIFFFINGCIALDSVRRDISWWSLYNGCIGYCAMVGLFLLEYLVRIRTMRRALATVRSGVMVLTIVFWGVASSVLAEDTIPGTPPTLSELQHILEAPVPFKAEFTEKKEVKVLSSPLESRGIVYCVPGEGIVWHAKVPFPRTYAITRTGIHSYKGGKISHSTTDRAGISDAMLALMSGTYSHTQRRFTITTSGTKDRWSITLIPKDSLVLQIMKSISVEGRTHPEMIEVFHENGDKVITSLSTPTPLTESEIASTTELLHDSPQ